MFNNTFQAILLLVTFTIRRKKSSLKINIGNTAAQTSVTRYFQHGWRPLSWVRRVSVLSEAMAIDTAQDGCWFCHCRGAPSVWGTVSATSVLKCGSSTWVCALFPHHLTCCRRADVCYREPERDLAASAPSVSAWSRSGNMLHVPLLSEKPLHFILDKVGRSHTQLS